MPQASIISSASRNYVNRLMKHKMIYLVRDADCTGSAIMCQTRDGGGADYCYRDGDVEEDGDNGVFDDTPCVIAASRLS